MFGLIGSLIGWLSYHLGIRGTDTASATGSLHGKVMDVKAALGTSGDNRASNTVMGWQSTQIKSWQRVTGSGNTALTISSVTPSKCIVMLNGGGYGVDSQSNPGSYPYYVSAFTSSSITTAPSFAPTTSFAGTVSVIIVEFY